jgi:hypothetical protein
MRRNASRRAAARMRRTASRMRRTAAILRRNLLGHGQGWRYEREHCGNDKGAKHRNSIHGW